jgi:hypothetical protein
VNPNWRQWKALKEDCADGDRIESSTNFATSQPAGFTTNATGTAQFQQTVPPDTDKLYYRALLLP